MAKIKLVNNCRNGIKTGVPRDLIVTSSGQEVTDKPVRITTKPHPRLVNRGTSGLLHSSVNIGGKLANRGPAGLDQSVAATPGDNSKENVRPPSGEVDRIRCAGEVVEIASLRLDHLNARLHPERNMQAIEDSLNLYGQCSPITVRRAGRVVMKGNGTVQAMLNLGWTKVACSLVDFEEVEALGYGLADNRSGEHARWDFEMVAKIDKLMREAGQNHQVGWSLDELEVLRAANWTPPEVSDDGFDHEKPSDTPLTEEQRLVIDAAVARFLEREAGLDAEAATKFGLSWGECVKVICSEWMEKLNAVA